MQLRREASKGARKLAAALVATAALLCAAQGVFAQDSKDQFIIWSKDPGYAEEGTTLQKIMKEKYGFDFKMNFTQGDKMTALNLKLAAGGFDDIAVQDLNPIVLTAMRKADAVMDMTPYFNMPDKYPNLAKVPKEVLDYCRSADGKIWYIPAWYAQEMDKPWTGWQSDAFFVNTNILSKVGAKKEDLSTIAGLESVLRKIKAAGLKDDTGAQVIPMGFLKNNNTTIPDDYRVLAAFGVDVATQGLAPVKKVGSSFVFHLDDPGYKAGYQWMSKMYRDGLIDPEVVTQKLELFKQKGGNGKYAIMPTSMWNFTWSWEPLDGPTAAPWYFEPVKNPKAPNADRPGTLQIINPYPGTAVYVSKNTKHLEQILKFMDFCLKADPTQQQVLNEGPEGVNWHWTGAPLGEWDFNADYGKLRNSGDNATVAKLTPQLYYLTTYSSKWYPWWTNAVGPTSHKGSTHTRTYTELIGSFGNVRSVHNYDTVTAKAGGLWEKYGATLKSLQDEYEAKLIMASSDAAFDKVWASYRDALEKRAHWTDLKAEWNASYKEQSATKGNF